MFSRVVTTRTARTAGLARTRNYASVASRVPRPAEYTTNPSIPQMSIKSIVPPKVAEAQHKSEFSYLPEMVAESAKKEAPENEQEPTSKPQSKPNVKKALLATFMVGLAALTGADNDPETMEKLMKCMEDPPADQSYKGRKVQDEDLQQNLMLLCNAGQKDLDIYVLDESDKLAQDLVKNSNVVHPKNLNNVADCITFMTRLEDKSTPPGIIVLPEDPACTPESTEYFREGLRKTVTSLNEKRGFIVIAPNSSKVYDGIDNVLKVGFGPASKGADLLVTSETRDVTNVQEAAIFVGAAVSRLIHGLKSVGVEDFPSPQDVIAYFGHQSPVSGIPMVRIPQFASMSTHNWNE